MNFQYNLKDVGIEFNVITDKNQTNIDEKNLNLYVIELVRHNLEDLEYIFKNISLEFKKLMTDNKLKLLFYFPDTGMDLDIEGNSYALRHWCLNLHTHAQKHGFGAVKKYLVTGDFLLQQNYQKFVQNNKITSTHQFSQVFGLSYNDYLYHDALSQGYVGQHADHPDQVPYKTKNFLCYNYKLSMSRLMIVSELDRFRLLQDSLVSWNMALSQNVPLQSLPADYYDMLREMYQNLNSSECSMSAAEKEYFNALLDHLHHFAKHMKPIYLDWHLNKHFTKPTGVEVHFDPTHYASTYFSLVTETGLSEGGALHLSEKIFKPLAHGHPLIVVGSKNSLAQLRNLGYYTFPEFFDESYDNLPEGGSRVKAVVEQVISFCKLSKKEKDHRFNAVKEKLKYNWYHFRKNAKKEFCKNFTNIFASIHSD